MATGFRHPLNIDTSITVGVAKARISHTDLTVEDTSQTFVFNTIAAQGVPAKSRIMFAWVNAIKPFAGGGNTAVTIKLGDVADDDELIAAVSVFTGASGILPKSGAYTLGTYEAAYAPRVIITTTDGTCAGLLEGLLEVFIQYETLNDASMIAA